jgi:hypothetical protein
MSNNTRLLLIALVILVVFGIFLQSLIARSLQESFGPEAAVPQLPPRDPAPMPGLPGGVKPPVGIPTTPAPAPAPPKKGK